MGVEVGEQMGICVRTQSILPLEKSGNGGHIIGRQFKKPNQFSVHAGSRHGKKDTGQNIKGQFSPPAKVFFRVKCILLGLFFQVGDTLKEDFPDL